VTSIGGGAFAGCIGLTSVTFDTNAFVSGVANISGSFANVFNNTPNISNITIGENVLSIRDFMFSGRTNLINISIPNSVTSIGRSAFADCTSTMFMKQNAIQ
jgi:hypothetical protein